jgi:valyl-tRNA synthetase
MGRNFANKIWNAGRFLLMNAAEHGAAPATPALADAHADLADRWIVSRHHSTAVALNEALGKFEINSASKILYDFVWHDFCDWYVEMMKGRLYGDEPAEVKLAVLGRAIMVFEETMKLLHPFMPFITEELWQSLRPRNEGESVMVAPFPEGDRSRVDPDTEREMAFVQECINSIRNVRGELSIPPSKEISLLVRFDDPAATAVLVKYERYFRRLARVAGIREHASPGKPAQAAGAVVRGGEIFIPLEGLIDLDAERNRLEKELNRVAGMFESTQKKLGNASFVEKAPPAVVDQERAKLESFRATMDKLKASLDTL